MRAMVWMISLVSQMICLITRNKSPMILSANYLNKSKGMTFRFFLLREINDDMHSDEERYKAEEAQKRVLVNALRSLSSTETDSTPPKDPLAEEEFVFVPPSEAAESGFVKVLSSKKTRAVVGALVAFAVVCVFSFISFTIPIFSSFMICHHIYHAQSNHNNYAI